MRVIRVAELFETASVPIQGPVPWLKPIDERASGVYVVTLVDLYGASVGHLPKAEAEKWNEGQQIIYIGRAKQIQRRIRQFYRHVYGDPRPHRGGQAILLLGCPMQVYWGTSELYEASEDKMIEAFRSAVGKLPFANRTRAALPRQRRLSERTG